MLCTNPSAKAYVNVPLCPVEFFEALKPVHPSGVCVPLHFVVFVHVSVPVHALSVSKPVQSGVFCCPHAHVSFMFVVAPFKHSFWVAPPILPCFHCIYYISVMGALLPFCPSALLPFCLGAHGWVPRSC